MVNLVTLGKEKNNGLFLSFFRQANEGKEFEGKNKIL
jgi:hypothetical protein